MYRLVLILISYLLIYLLISPQPDTSLCLDMCVMLPCGHFQNHDVIDG